MSLFTSVYFIMSMRKFIVNRWEIDCSRLITFNSFKFDSKLSRNNCLNYCNKSIDREICLRFHKEGTIKSTLSGHKIHEVFRYKKRSECSSHKNVLLINFPSFPPSIFCLELSAFRHVTILLKVFKKMFFLHNSYLSCVKS